jgi:hypothetical protein
MVDKTIVLTKITALKKSFSEIDYGSNSRALGLHVNSLFDRYYLLTDQLRVANPDLFGDLPKPKHPMALNNGAASDKLLFKPDEITPLIESLSYILNVAKELASTHVNPKRLSNRVFITHGRSQEWRKVQEYIEKTLGLQTLELAQEPSKGRVILNKLNEESEKCGVAVIIMTGEDIVGDEVRARENVMHEIGFFQGKYGFARTILMHEQGANIPTNIGGLGYVSFSKDAVSTGFGELLKELNAVIPIINGKVEY